MNNNLIYDLGVYDSEDSEYFLNKGYNVIGVECNPNKISLLKNKYKNEINSSKFKLIDKCISDKSNELIHFYISSHEDWSSTNSNIANRAYIVNDINVETITLYDLFKKFGVPYYCKIDIEGNDYKALSSLTNLNISELPNFISAESECLGKDKKDNDDYYSVLDILYKLGYRNFLLYDYWSNGIILNLNYDIKNCNPHDLVFNNQDYIWMDYDTIKSFIKNTWRRKDGNYMFWADIFASKH